MATVKSNQTGGGIILIANHHAAPFHFPQYDDAGKALQHITVEPHAVAEVPVELWQRMKSTEPIKYLLNQGSLAEVKTRAPVPIHTDSTSDPEIPEHLLAPEETQSQPVGDIGAEVKNPKPGVSAVNVDIIAK